MEEKNKVLDLIITLLNTSTTKEGWKYIEGFTNGKSYRLYAVDYLLNQIIRNIDIAEDHYYISVEADRLWNELSEDKISNFYYKKEFVVEKDIEKTLGLYKGSEKSPSNFINVKKGTKIEYRQIFHDEHVIPIKIIIDELKKLENPNYENVSKILDNIYICRMLKDENAKIKEAYKRNYSLKDVIENIYGKYNICIKNYKY